MTDILLKAKQIEEKLISMRRYLHSIPEFGGNLPETRKFVCKQLDSLGIPYTLNSEDDGLIAEIKGAKSGKVLGLRADMDALNIKEETGLPFASKFDGKMHGCGHDAHTAILLAAAEIINQNKDSLNGTVRLIFQSGEETGTGAKAMIKEGVLNGLDALCATHVGNLTGEDLTPGTITVSDGAATAGKAKFSVVINGKGTHSAYPQRGIDPIMTGVKIIEESHKMIREELKGENVILAFANFSAGEDHNTIPSTATLKGSIRAQSVKARDYAAKRFSEICDEVSAEFGATVDKNIILGSIPVINDKYLAKTVSEAIKSVVDPELVVTQPAEPLMGSDDFCNFAAKVPSVYFFIHTNNFEKGIKEVNHNPKFDVDESVLYLGVASFVAIVDKYLGL